MVKWDFLLDIPDNPHGKAYVEPMTKNYRIGDTVVYSNNLGQRLRVVVDDKQDDIKNGSPGFSGVTTTGDEVWGYDDQIISIIAKK